MKAISLWQPWASLWLSPAKIHETRHWETRHRGQLLVHAAKKFVKDVPAELDGILHSEFGHHWGIDLPTGAVVGVVNLTICVRTADLYLNRSDLADEQLTDYACGDHSYGRFAWRRSSYRRFNNPVPFRGHQSIFEVPDDLVRGQIEASREVLS